MKVGDYVRTKDGYIFKIEELLEKGKYNDSEDKIVQRFRIDGLYQKNEDYMETDYIYSDWIIKSSPNIIDLIEIGDYVNGFKVEDVYKPEGTYVLWLTLSCNPIDRWKNEDIKSIVTKEQFESMEYEVKE